MGYKVTVMQWNEQRCLGALRWKGCALSAQFLIGGSNVGVLNLHSGKSNPNQVMEGNEQGCTGVALVASSPPSRDRISLCVTILADLKL